MIIFRLLFKFFGKIFKFLGVYSRFVPMGLAGIFIVSDFITNWFMYNLPFAFKNMAVTIFSAELVINEKVHLAISNSVEYGFFDFVHIIVSVYVLYALVKFIARTIVAVGGGQAIFGCYVIAIIVVGIIEISAIKVIDGEFGFIPLWNGVIFLALNLKPVLLQIFLKGSTTIVPNVVNITNNVTTYITNSSQV